MRHVKLRPGVDLDERALEKLIVAACDDVRRRKMTLQLQVRES
jgi:hypothetical protein